MRIRWTPTAAADLQNIYDYFKEHEPHLAQPTVIEIHKSVRSLKYFHCADARDVKKAHANYCSDACRISSLNLKDDAVEILHVWHPAWSPPYKKRKGGPPVQAKPGLSGRQ
jgi:plasmid stabilization system protein ParE